MKSFLLLGCLLVSGVLAGDESNTTVPANITDPTPPPTTSVKPTSTTPTPTPSTTTPPPSTTTPPPSTTTPSPTSTTTPGPTPTPAPKPVDYYWKVEDSSGKPCILAKADIKLDLTRHNGSKAYEVAMYVPKNASASGSCENVTQTLKLVWTSVNSSFVNSIIFKFMVHSPDHYYLSNVSAYIYSVPDLKTIELASGPLKHFETPKNSSYECSWVDPLTLEETDALKNSTKASVAVFMTAIHFEAFITENRNDFGQVSTCPNDLPDVVPIMVGIAMVLLIVIVLIAYLVGRRRSQAQGYLSM